MIWKTENDLCFKMCGRLFSFCFLHETAFGNGQIAITHNTRLGEGWEIELQMFANR
jgi:hypothetical protein